VPHSFPQVEAIEFGGFQFYSYTTPLRSQDYGIVGSSLAVGRFLIVDLIEQRHLFVVGGPVVF
jgi:hypothetical protein